MNQSWLPRYTLKSTHAKHSWRFLYIYVCLSIFALQSKYGHLVLYKYPLIRIASTPLIPRWLLDLCPVLGTFPYILAASLWSCLHTEGLGIYVMYHLFWATSQGLLSWNSNLSSIADRINHLATEIWLYTIREANLEVGLC